MYIYNKNLQTVLANAKNVGQTVPANPINIVEKKKETRKLLKYVSDFKS